MSTPVVDPWIVSQPSLGAAVGALVALSTTTDRSLPPHSLPACGPLVLEDCILVYYYVGPVWVVAAPRLCHVAWAVQCTLQC